MGAGRVKCVRVGAQRWTAVQVRSGGNRLAGLMPRHFGSGRSLEINRDRVTTAHCADKVFGRLGNVVFSFHTYVTKINELFRQNYEIKKVHAVTCAGTHAASIGVHETRDRLTLTLYVMPCGNRRRNFHSGRKHASSQNKTIV